MTDKKPEFAFTNHAPCVHKDAAAVITLEVNGVATGVLLRRVVAIHCRRCSYTEHTDNITDDGLKMMIFSFAGVQCPGKILERQ